MEGTAYYREKLQQKISHANFSLWDCPKNKDGFSYSSFDDEGVERKDLCLVENGVLKSFVHNSATARFFQVPNTGHAARGARGSLGTGCTQLFIKPGQASDAELYAGKVLKVLSLKGLHSGTNAISGFFSLAIEACLMNQGVVEKWVKDVTISGNFYELLNQIQLLGSDVKVASGKSFFSPEIRFAGLSVAGA